MPNTTTTPYMNLELPIPGTQTGPQYATDNNAAFTLIDSHTHIAGQGQPVPTEGILVNADFPFNGYNATTLRTARFTDQSAALAEVTDLACMYSVDGDLYWNDGVGNQVQVTASGAVNVAGSGNISGMGATTATVVYTSVNTRFTFNSNTSTPANLACGPIILGRNTASPSLVTITPSASQVSDFTLTLPAALPGSESLVTLSSSGQLTATNTLSQALTLSNTATFGAAATFNGSATLNGTTTVNGAATFNGAVTFAAPTINTLTLNAGWSGTLYYWKDAEGYVNIDSSQLQYSGGASVNIATTNALPAAYRPAAQKRFNPAYHVYGSGTAGTNPIFIETNGTIRAFSSVGVGDSYWLAGIRYRTT